MKEIENVEGMEEGEICGRNGCTGEIMSRGEGSCSCHLNPPCATCTAGIQCSICDFEDGPNL